MFPNRHKKHRQTLQKLRVQVDRLQDEATEGADATETKAKGVEA